MAVPTKDAVIPDDAPDHLLLAKHIDFIANYGKVVKTNSSVFLVHSSGILIKQETWVDNSQNVLIN
jgi:hypothetical protein